MVWENLLGEGKKFHGSNATVRGTCVHFAAEIVANAKMNGEPHDSEALADAIQLYIDGFDNNTEYDTGLISSTWKNMAEPLIREYVIPYNTVATEEYIQHEIRPGIYVGGTFDRMTSSFPTDIPIPSEAFRGTYKAKLTIEGNLTLGDWKTVSTKPSSFSWAYYLQQLTYAYILHQKGIKVEAVELLFTVAPTKTLPVRTFKFSKPFDTNAYEMIEGILHLIADSVQVFNDYGDLQYLLAGDFRLKKNDIPVPE